MAKHSGAEETHWDICFSIIWICHWKKKVEPRDGPHLGTVLVNMIIKEKSAPPSKVAPFSKTAPEGGAILAPLFFSVVTCSGSTNLKKEAY